jgi:hypothetical protein
MWVWPWDPSANRNLGDTLAFWGNGLRNVADAWGRLSKAFCGLANLGNDAAAQDALSCACFAVGVADIIPALSTAAVELTDCACNVVTTAQTFCNSGFVPGVAYSALTAIDCLAPTIGAAGGALAGGAGGFVLGGPEGAAAGAILGYRVGEIIGDPIIDIAASAAQNYATQGTIFPAAQYTACCNTAARGRGAVARLAPPIGEVVLAGMEMRGALGM